MILSLLVKYIIYFDSVNMIGCQLLVLTVSKQAQFAFETVSTEMFV